MAVASMILGIAGACMIFIIWIPVVGWFSFGPAVLAVIFGAIALGNKDPAVAGRGMAVAGLVLGIIVACIGLIFRVFWGGL